MKTDSTLLLSLLLASVALTSHLHSAESPSILLQKGIYAEETEGNIETAIAIYEGIAKESDANRGIVAQAHYRLGVCLLKRGKREDATAQFRKLIEQFPLEASLVSKAKGHLIEFGNPAAPVVARHLWTMSGDISPASSSATGQIIPYIVWVTGDLWIRDLRTSSNRKLTQSSGWTNSAEHPINALLSWDDSAILYDWYNKTIDGYELRLIKLSEPTSKTLISEKDRSFFAATWAPDGKSVVFADWKPLAKEGNLMAYRLADGTQRQITSLEGTYVEKFRFAPDGRSIAYQAKLNRLTASSDSSTNNIILVDVETGTKTTLLEPRLGEHLVGWTPDGSEIAFTSTRDGTLALWTIAIKNGRPHGAPKLVRPELGEISPVDLSRDGSLIYTIDTPAITALQRVSVDFQSGKIISPPKSIQAPTLSRSDKVTRVTPGKFLYYRSSYQAGATRGSFSRGMNSAITLPAAYVLNLETGEHSMIEGSSKWIHRVGWWWPNPDHQSLYVALYGAQDVGGLFVVHIKSGDIKPIALHQQNIEQLMDNPIRFRPSPDFITFARLNKKENKLRVVKYETASGKETEYDVPGFTPETLKVDGILYRERATLLPDGSSFFFNKKLSTGEYVLVRHNLLTGQQTDFMRAPERIGLIDSEPDQFFFVKRNQQNQFVFTHYTTGKDSELRPGDQVTLPDGYDFRGQHFGGLFLFLIKDPTSQSDEMTPLWTLSVRTGELKNTGLLIPTNEYWGLRNNETELLYRINTTSASRELWTMENLFPPRRP